MKETASATTRTVRTDGVEIATEAFGDPADVPVLLIMGAMASMLWWPDEFCRRLAGAGHYVVRYDNRDTGLSTTWDADNITYTFDDMVGDAVRILDAYGIAAAHVAGMSMGGMIAQLATLDHPTRVLSLTAISTTPVGIDTASLPGPTRSYLEHSAQAEGLDWSDGAAVIAFMVKEMRVLAGPDFPFDAAAARAFVERDYRRARRFASATNHFRLAQGRQRAERLSDLDTPLLVIHGTADPIFPVEHGEALAKAVAGARLVRLDGGGHELNEAHWPRIVAAMTAVTTPEQQAG